VVDAVAAVESLSDLFIGLDEAFKLNVQFSVLAGEHVAVVLESFDFSSAVVVAAVKRLVGEAQVVLLSSGGGQGFISDAALGLKVV
jgi:hypothetical protein